MATAAVVPDEQQAEPLPQPVQDALKDMCNKMQMREQFARIWEIRDSQKQRFFERGIQHIFWNQSSKCYQIIGSTGVGSVDTSNASQQPSYTDDFNIYQGYEKSFCAVFTQNQASCRAEPDNPKEAMDVAAAREAEKFKRVIEKSNEHKEVQRQIARLLWTDRRVLAWTRYVVDRKGKGSIVTSIYGTLESKVPIASKGIADWPYCQIASEIDITVAKDRYPDIKDKITGGNNGSDVDLVARNARMAVNEGTFLNAQSGDTTDYYVTESHVWFRPSFYNTQDKTVAEQLLELFPAGVHCTFVDGTFAQAQEEEMEDALEVMHALPGDGMSRVSIGACMVPIQENFNDLMNQAIECYDYCIPAKWIDEEAVDIDAIQEQEAQRGAYYPMERRANEALSNNIFEETAVTVPADMAAFMQEISGPLSQFLTAQQPSLFGGEMGEAGKTAKGYQMAAQQALGVMGLIWTPYTVFYSKIMKQSIKASAKARIEEQTIDALVPRQVQGSRKNETITIDLQDLAEGNFNFTTDVDAQFPESWSQQRAVYFQLLEGAATNPELAAELMQPDNLALARDLIGLEGFTLTSADSRDKQLSEIDEMIKGPGPMPNPAAAQIQAPVEQGGLAPAAPLPPPEVSSVPIDPVYDNHQVEYDEVTRFINAPEGQKLKAEQPAQFQDIRLHGLEHKAVLDQRAMQAQQAAMMQANTNPQGAQPNA